VQFAEFDLKNQDFDKKKNEKCTSFVD